MDYRKFLQELADWMEASNQRLKQFGFDSDVYWQWVMQSSGELCNSYGNHPLCLEIMAAVLRFQDDNFKKVTNNEK